MMGNYEKWYVVSNGHVPDIGDCISIAKTPESYFNRPLICIVSRQSEVNDNDMKNALLISKAPELLEMLEKISTELEMFNPPSKETALAWSGEINELIKEATEL